ncbi:MAG: hypothetical protein Q9183_003513, partial [Haloplaca sp. 2 TL-2023]
HQVTSVVQSPGEDGADPTSAENLNDGAIGTELSSQRSAHRRNHFTKRDDGLVNSHLIEEEMRFISLPDQAQVSDYTDFVYDKSAGANVMIYIVDTGADLRNNDEFPASTRANIRWLHASGADPPDPTEDDLRGAGHGTGVLAKAAGWKHGIAKRSNPVVVRVNNLGDPGAYLDGIRQAYRDWETNHYIGHETTATGILNLSWGWKPESLKKSNYDARQQFDWVVEMRKYLQAQPITPSGNSPLFGPPNIPVDEYPQLFAYGNPADVPDMMVVGGIGTDGRLWKRSKVDPPGNDVIKVYAPCYHLMIPHAQTGGYRFPAEVEGVSYGPVILASPTVAGLGAYFLGLSSLSDSLHDDDPVKRIQKLKAKLQAGSCITRSPNICALHNLADPRQCPPYIPFGFQKGNEVECRVIEAASTQATTAQVTTTTSTQEICVQATPIDDKPAATCTTRTEGFPATPLPEGAFACTNFCWWGIEGKPRSCEIPGAQPNGAPKPEATSDSLPELPTEWVTVC